MNPPSVSVVVPVYNSAEGLPALLARLLPVLQGRAAPYEVILVNDGSRDHSWDVVRTLAGQWPGVRGINLSRNYGQHNALLCGIRSAGHEVVVTMDDDLQHPPEEVPALLARLAEGYDVVYGTPHQEQHGWWRDGASVLTKLALRHVMGTRSARHVSAFRAFRAHLREAFAGYRNPFVAIDALLSWSTTRFAAVTVRHEPRRFGRSNYNLRKLAVHAMNLTTGFSTAPLHLASLLGFVFILFGVGTLGVILTSYLLRGTPLPGFPFLASIIILFSGTQLFALGIIGEYLARVFSRILDRPPYLVREEAGPQSTE